MVKQVSYPVYEASDMAERALSLVDDDPCPGGPHCPRCRMASAVTQLNGEFSLPFDFADGMLTLMCLGLPDRQPWGREEADEAIRAAAARMAE